MGKPPTTDQELTARVAALEADMAEVQARVETHEQRLVAQQAEITALMALVDTLERDLSDMDARVTALEAGTTTPPDPVEPPDPEPGPEPPAGVVTVHKGGSDYVYDPANGTDLGDYVDPAGRFVMSCIRVKHADCPLVLDLRGTIPGDEWRCVVFEYSDPLRGDLANLTYSVTIERDGNGPLVIDVPDHYANASWRWQSCPWPHPLTPLATLYERKLLPRHDAALACGKAGNLTNVHSAPPMSLCGFTGNMGATGGRADIGVLTGWQAEWACTEGADMLKTVLVQGETAFCWRFRDREDGTILDAFRKYPQASLHWGNGPSGNPQIYQGTGNKPGLDAAHCPSCYYLPFLLTGDPYFLEMLQGETAYCAMEIQRNPQTVIGSEQIRGVAWSLRNLFHCAIATPDDTPPWILSKAIFAEELERQRGLIEAKRNDGWTFRAFAHVIDTFGRWQHAMWQHDYATSIVAWISMHDDRWAGLRDWMVEGIDGRSNPDSGWCPGYPTSYWTNTGAANDYAPDLAFKTWAESWDYNSKYVYTDTPGGVCPTLESRLQLNTTYDYFSAMMHALRLAKQAGSTAADAALERLTGPWEQGLRTVGYTEWKYCGCA